MTSEVKSSIIIFNFVCLVFCFFIVVEILSSSQPKNDEAFMAQVMLIGLNGMAQRQRHAELVCLFVIFLTVVVMIYGSMGIPKLMAKPIDEPDGQNQRNQKKQRQSAIDEERRKLLQRLQELESEQALPPGEPNQLSEQENIDLAIEKFTQALPSIPPEPLPESKIQLLQEQRQLLLDKLKNLRAEIEKHVQWRELVAKRKQSEVKPTKEELDLRAKEKGLLEELRLVREELDLVEPKFNQGNGWNGMQ